MTIEEIRKRLEELNDEAVEIQAQADVEKRDLTPEEQVDLKGKLDQVQDLKEQLELRQRLEDQQKWIKNADAEPVDGQNRKTEPDIPGRKAGDLSDAGDARGHTPIRVTDRVSRDPKCGWRSYGDFAMAVRAAGSHGGQPDKRLFIGETRATLSTYGAEAVGADGGFAIPPDFKSGIAGILTDEQSLLSRTDQQISSSNVFTVPTDEATPWGTSGVRAYWEGEADAITQSKPALKANTLRLNKLAVLVPVTDELLEDAPSLGNYLNRKAPEAMRSKVDTAIVGGNGVGRPLGIINAPGTISVAKEGSQTADTINRLNIEKIWTRVYAAWRSRAVWLANQDIETELMHMYGIDTEGTPLTTWPIYLPSGGYSGSPFSTLFGRPILFTQACETLGDLGDIILADLSQYLTVTKTGGIRSDVSIHLWFDQDATAFRFIMRLAGQPWWQAAMSARDGTTTYSPFVTLAERA
jgi:HK97 family phage major capsid protein